MENTLWEGENLLVSKIGYTPQQDDVIVFHLTMNNATPPIEKTLVKRVIATEGQKVEINFKTKEIRVDDELYEDTHMVLKDYFGKIVDEYSLMPEHHFDLNTETFSAIVPDGCVFVLGDNRNNSRDSRDFDIGFVDERCILGKVIVRISPFTLFE